MTWLLVFAGGGLGALLRYELGGWVQARAGADLPWGTFAVNAVGCMAIGWLATWIDERGGANPSWRMFAIPGLLGGFTTFSAFGLETWRLAEAGRLAAAGANAAGSFALCIAAVGLGVVIARL
jgi:CrcB protein